MLRILTDRGSEYCGNRESHEYALYLDLENIDRTRTRPGVRRRTESANGSIRPFKTSSMPAPSGASCTARSTNLQADVDQWIEDLQCRTRALWQILLRQDAAADFHRGCDAGVR
jgi:hypothetical protein